MPATSNATTTQLIPAYFVVMLDYGRRGREAIIDPELTRRDVVGLINDGNYPREDILFIQYVHGATVETVTEEIFAEVEPLIAEAA
jgi:hypothetical protein